MKQSPTAAYAVPLLCLFSSLHSHLCLADPNASRIEQVLVTAARVPVPGEQVSSAYTVLSRDDIALRQARYLSDLLRTVPGFAISQSGGAGAQTQVRVRGAESNHVLVLIDGVRANDAATSDDFRWEHLSTGDIQRVEIIRGPQSALWGSDAVAAVVNIVTGGGAPGTRLDGFAEAGVNDTRNARIGGRVTEGDWQVRGSVESLQTDGINTARTGAERDGSSLNTLNLGLRRSAGDGLVVDASVRATQAVSEFDPVDAVTTGLPADGDRESQSDTWLARINANIGDAQQRISWQLRAAMFDSEHRNRSDGVGTNQTASQRMTLGIQANIAVSDSDVLVLAVERENTDYSQRGEIGFGDPNQNQRLRLNSAMFEYRHRQAEGLSWSLSGRYDDYNAFESALTGKVSAHYTLGERTQLRANIGTGQKTPTFTERFGFFPDQFIGNPELKPERSVSYELGLRQTLFDERASVEVNVYHQDLRDEINGFVFDPNTFLATADNLDNESEREGFEVAAQWQLTPALRADTMYSYTEASEENAGGESVTELRRPRHTGSLGLHYAPVRQRFSGALVADYSSARKDRFFPPFPASARTVELDSYWLVELTAQYQLTPGVVVFARGTNLLDERYEQVFGYRTQGRAAFVGIRSDFNF